MKVILSRSCTVQAEEPTWTGLMPLSESDQIGFVTHAQTIYFYKLSNSSLIADDTIFTTLKTSLSKVLVHFYPVAGRLTWLQGSRLELHCNGKGVQLIEASCVDATLFDFGDFTRTTHNFKHLVPEINYKDDPIEEIPLLIVQLTKFTCGGIAIGLNMSHALVDGQGSFHFVSEWARIARGESLGAMPIHDRKLVLRAGDPPSAPPRRFHHDLSAPRSRLICQSSSSSNNKSTKSNKGTTIAMLKLSKVQVKMLKIKANMSSDEIGNRAYTSYESIVGHIWRCACKAREHAYNQPTSVGVCINIRRRMQPQLPENFFGNAIEYVTATASSGELVTRPLGYAVGKIREVIDKVTSEYVHSSIDFVKNLKDLSDLQDIHAKRNDRHWAFYGNPNIGVISWMSLPIYGVDFGWGKEIFTAPVMSDGDGDSVILPGYDGNGSLLVAMCLESKYMEAFENYFCQRPSNL